MASVVLASMGVAAAQAGGTCVSGPPSYSIGLDNVGYIATNASGELEGAPLPTYFYVRLSVDGKIIWENQHYNGKGFPGVLLPMTWPGLLFNYNTEVPYTLSPGTHTIAWIGSTNVQIRGQITPGNFSYTVKVTVS